MQPFLITGLPRSRTAWMAHFFTVPGVWCEHEPSYHFTHLNDLEAFYARGAGHGMRVGASDHGLGWWLPEIIRKHGAKVLLIERDIHDVNADLIRLGLKDGALDYLRELRRRENLMRAHPNVLCVPYSKIDEPGRMERAWFHCLPGVPFDEARFQYMRRFNIQLTGDWINHLLARNKPSIFDQCAQYLKEHQHA